MPSVRDRLTATLKDRRKAQAGTTLIELLVSLMIVGLALVLIVGTFSTGLLDATLAKRNTAVDAVVQYEMEKIGASAFSASAPTYSECFATESPSSPAAAPCTGAQYTLRADVTWAWNPSSSTVQVWTIAITSLPSGTQVGSPVSVLKVAYQ
jgi:type II secretory pathway pseudopilin PulG